MVLAAAVGYAQDLGLSAADLRMENSTEGGYYLYVRQKPGVGSVLLTESTEDPDREVATYALRNPEYHRENGDELRMLDGEFLESEGLFSLIDSTPVPDDQFGSAFKIFVPYMVEYGYPWSRQGEIMVLDGTYLSIRTFSEPYADYRGGFQDNPFILRVTQAASEPDPEPEPDPKPDPIVEEPEPEPEPEPVADEPEPEPEPIVSRPAEGRNYMPDTVENFTAIADEGGGEVVFSEGQDDIVNQISEILDRKSGRSLDLVLALDTTKSMEDDLPFIQERLVPLLREKTGRYERFRVGVVYYRDYLEAYLNRIVEFQDNLDFLQEAVNSIRVDGGRDLPEAVYEALYAGLQSFPWEADAKVIVLIGDAPPHPRPRGDITSEMVYALARESGVDINAIILPHE